MPAIAMEGDVDAFLREVRSSEQLLQELQERLRAVQAETERQRAAVAALSSERRGLAEEQLSGEQELAAAASARELQEVRLTRVQEFRAGVRRELAEVATERTDVRARLQEEVGALCTEAAQHLNRFGLRGSYREQHKQRKLDELSKLKAQTDTLSREITSLRQQESILQQELEKLSATEREVEVQRVSLRQPLEGRTRVQQLQQTLSHLVQEQRDGRHVQQLTADVSDAEDETTCLRSAAGAMTSELQRLEQLLWFTNMERMKQRMRAQARCPGQYHCATAGAFREQTAGDSTPSFTGAAPPPGSARREGPPAPVMEEPADQHGPDAEDADVAADETDVDADDGSEEPPPDGGSRGLPAEWSGQDTDRQPAAPAAGAGDSGHSSSAGLGFSSASGSGGGGPSAAELAQRRWGARRALMMARRQPPTAAAPSAPAHHPPPSTAPRPPPVDPAPPPPLASVRPQQRLVNTPASSTAPSATTPATASPGRRSRGWGRAAAPGRLSYRGPQPAKRTGMDFRTGLQKLREQMAEEMGVGTAGSAQKRVRFAAEPPPEEDPVDWDDEDFL